MKRIVAIMLVIAAFFTLCTLGYWQTQRLAWKEGIIEKLDKEYQKTDTITVVDLDDLNKKPLNTIRYGMISGRFLHDKEILVGPKPRDGDIGYQVVTPFKTAAEKFILVNRGWINTNQTDQIRQSYIQGNIALKGLFRTPDWNRFTPDNSPENNIWTKLNIQQIAQEKNITGVSPFMLYVSESSKTYDPVILNDDKWYPRNKHKQYAIFWFSMAFVLLILTGLFVRKKNSIS